MPRELLTKGLKSYYAPGALSSLRHCYTVLGIEYENRDPPKKALNMTLLKRRLKKNLRFYIISKYNKFLLIKTYKKDNLFQWQICNKQNACCYRWSTEDWLEEGGRDLIDLTWEMTSWAPCAILYSAYYRLLRRSRT